MKRVIFASRLRSSDGVQSGVFIRRSSLGIPDYTIYFERLAINVPIAMPAPKPKANIPIFIGEGMLPHNETEAATAMIRNRSAVPVNALFDFILVSP
jgi:hypothetical protein